MRAIFGLVGILVVIGVIVWWLGAGGGLEHTQRTLETGQTARDQVSQLAGQDRETGRAARESANLELITSQGRPDSILVVSVVPGGAYERYFGLQDNDTILQIGPLSVKENITISSDADAEAFLMDAYQKQQQLLVVRDGEQITLPQQPAAGEPVPAAQPQRGSDPLQQQLDGIGARRGL